MKKILFPSILFISLAISCGKKQETATEALKADKNTDKVDSIQSVTNNSWEYSEEIDKMGDKIYYAQNITSKDLGLEFPYKNSYASLIIRNKLGKNDIIFQVTKGQIKGYMHEGGAARVRFDDEKPFTANYKASSDGSSNIIFLENTKKLLAEIRTSKKMVIEIEFYNNGIRQIEFNTNEFKWDH